jgi:hypothetical protein
MHAVSYHNCLQPREIKLGLSTKPGSCNQKVEIQLFDSGCRHRSLRYIDFGFSMDESLRVEVSGDHMKGERNGT